MGRAERGFIGVLLRLQAARRKREAGDTTCDSDALTTHCVLGMLQQGLESLPPGPPVAAAPPAAPAEPERTRPLAFSELTEHDQQRSRLRSEADGYTLPNRVRVKQIRQLGGLPPDCDYEPPWPKLLDFLIHGTGSNLLWADTYEPWVPPAAPEPPD
jgi:hypothetical protein